MLQKRKKAKRENGVVLWVLSGVFALYAATLLMPLVWMLINSFKADNNFFIYHQWEFMGLSFDNYRALFSTENDILIMLGNTLILSLVTPTVSVFFSLCLGHGVASFDYKVKDLIYFLCIMPMFVAVAGTTPYMYKLMTDINLFDTYIGLVFMACGGYGFGFLIFYSIFKNISPTYSEAAMIDGAGYWRTFLQILLPQAKDMIVAQWVMSFIGTWNDFFGPYLFLPSYPTLSVGVKEISDNVTNGRATYPELFATIILSLIPVLTLYFVFQKKIMTVSLGGGIKG